MVKSRLIDAYREASDAYESANAGVGCCVETFTRFLVAERILLVSIGWAALTRLRLARG